MMVMVVIVLKTQTVVIVQQVILRIGGFPMRKGFIFQIYVHCVILVHSKTIFFIF
jgi:hypothetical protein